MSRVAGRIVHPCKTRRTPVDGDAGTIPREGGAFRDGGVDAGFETLPLGPDDIVSLSDADGIEIFTVGFVRGSGVQLFIERYDEPFVTGRLFRIDAAGRTFGPPTEVTFDSAMLVGNPLVVGDWLYTMHAETIQQPARIERRRFDGSTFSAPEVIRTSRRRRTSSRGRSSYR